MSLETHVVVLAGEEYVSGVGYTGPVLRDLGFPSGPYIKGVAELFVRQAKASSPKTKFKVMEYKA